MKIILLESVRKLGRAGEVVRAKNGYARNWLIPQGKASAATKANLALVEERRDELTTADDKACAEAQAFAETLVGRVFTVIAPAGENGQLYGAITPRAAAEALAQAGVEASRRIISLPAPVRALGLHPVFLQLHSDVVAEVTLNVARDEEEAAARLAEEAASEASEASSEASEASSEAREYAAPAKVAVGLGAEELGAEEEEEAKRAIAGAIKEALDGNKPKEAKSPKETSPKEAKSPKGTSPKETSPKEAKS